MAVRIRLTRIGAHKQPAYRVVVADGRSARDGRAIETLGHYNPRSEPVEFVVDADKAKAWLAKGALPTDRVLRFLDQAGVMQRDKRNNPTRAIPRKQRKAQAEEAAKAAAAAKASAAAGGAPAS